MSDLLTSEIAVALAGGLGAILLSIAFYIRTNSSLRREREITENEIRKINAQNAAADAEHRRNLEIMKAQMDAERLHDARATEQRLEEKLTAMLESEIVKLRAMHAAAVQEIDRIKEDRRKERERRQEVETNLRDLTQRFEREQELRKQLEHDFAQLKAEYEAEKNQRAAVELERNSLRTENRALLSKMKRMETELNDQRTAMSVLEKELRTLEAKVGKGDDDPPPSPASAPKPEDAKPLDADGAKDSAAVDVRTSDAKDEAA